MAETTYNSFKSGLANGDEDWVNGDYRVLLLTDAVAPDPDHATVAAVLAAHTESAGTAYARQALGSKTVTNNTAADRADLDAATADFGALADTTPTAMVVFRQVTNDSDSIPVSYHDTGFGTAANGAGYTVEFPNDVIRIS